LSPSDGLHTLVGMKTHGTSAPVRLLSVALSEEERAVLQAEAERRHVSMSLIVREVLADKLDGFREVNRDRRQVHSPTLAS